MGRRFFFKVYIFLPERRLRAGSTTIRLRNNRDVNPEQFISQVMWPEVFWLETHLLLELKINWSVANNTIFLLNFSLVLKVFPLVTLVSCYYWHCSTSADCKAFLSNSISTEDHTNTVAIIVVLSSYIYIVMKPIWGLVLPPVNMKYTQHIQL